MSSKAISQVPCVIVGTTAQNNLVSYTFLNQTTTCTFTTNTGGTIYGTHTGLNAGFFQVIRNGNDFFIDHP